MKEDKKERAACVDFPFLIFVIFFYFVVFLLFGFFYVSISFSFSFLLFLFFFLSSRVDRTAGDVVNVALTKRPRVPHVTELLPSFFFLFFFYRTHFTSDGCPL